MCFNCYGIRILGVCAQKSSANGLFEKLMHLFARKVVIGCDMRLDLRRAPMVGPVSYKGNQKHLISGFFVFLAYFFVF